MAARWKPSIIVLAAVQAITGGCNASRHSSEGDELIGTWSCRSTARTVSTMQFSRASDGSIAMSNRYTTKTGETGQYDETYEFDQANKLWTWTTTESSTGSKEQGIADPWTGPTWTFEGTRTMKSGSRQKIQMIYTRVGPNEFRRDFVVARRAAPATTSSSVCQRT